MRFSTAAAAAFSLPLLAAAEGPAPADLVQQYLGQAQDLFNKYFPNPARHDPVGAAQAKVGEMKMHTLTLSNWNETLFTNVKHGESTPEEWWVFITGGKKACFGKFLICSTSTSTAAARCTLVDTQTPTNTC